MNVIQLGDSAVSLVFEEKIDPLINAQCVGIAEAIERRNWPAIRDVVATYNAVTVHFDPLKVDRHELSSELHLIAAVEGRTAATNPNRVTIPVQYGGEFGPDLSAVAQFAGCSEDEVVRLHTGNEYRVYMLGFLPGFPYMGSVDRRIAMPRLDVPRVQVPAGSVAIAGTQTGIYPCVTPGGWRIIGRTSTRVFDSAREQTFLLKAGDYVIFAAL